MSAVSIESNNENQLTVEEYVRYIRIKDHIQELLDSARIKEELRSSEESINGLSIDLTIKYSIDKKKFS